MVRFRLAIPRPNKDAIFIGVSCWGKTADFVQQYLKKGNKVFIEGKLDSFKKDDGSFVYSICLRAFVSIIQALVGSQALYSARDVMIAMILS